MLFIRGRKPDDSFVDEMHWEAKGRPLAGPLWDGTYWRESLFTTSYLDTQAIPEWLSSGRSKFYCTCTGPA